MPHNSAVFIVGAIEGLGTQRLGEYMEENRPLPHTQTISVQNVALLFKATAGTVEQVV